MRHVKRLYRRHSLFLYCLAFIIILAASSCANQLSESRPNNVALHAWNSTQIRATIINFVKEVSNQKSSSFVPKEERIAVFDLDGTLLCEKPEYIEVLIMLKRLKEKAEADPKLLTNPIYSAAVNGNGDFFNNNPDNITKALLEAFEGEEQDFYLNYCLNFMNNQLHPNLRKPYIELFYFPMLELIKYLKDNGFSVYIVSTSLQGFIRSFSESSLRVVKGNVIGSAVAFEYKIKNGKAKFVRMEKWILPYNAKEGKAERIRERVGKTPILAFGNSGGDLAMLEWTDTNTYRHLILVLDHNDSDREYFYQKERLLKIARERNWIIVRMKEDFKVVF